MNTTFLIYLLFYFMFGVYAIRDSSNGRRGVARLMSTESNNTKRDEVTWYNGRDLRMAACFGRNGMHEFDAEEDFMIGAMAMHSFEQCFKCLQIKNNRNPSKKIVVQVIDKCEACELNTHIDLTPVAFKKLAPKGNLKIGIVDITFKPVRCPAGGVFDRIKKARKSK